MLELQKQKREMTGSVVCKFSKRKWSMEIECQARESTVDKETNTDLYYKFCLWQ